MIIFIWFYYLGNFLDFLTILLTGSNINNTNGFLGIFNWLWVAIGSIFQVYFAAELLITEKISLKRLITSIYAIIMISAVSFMLFYPFNNLHYINPNTPGEDLIYFHFILSSPAFILLIIAILYVIIFVVLGFLIKSIRSEGVLRKKYLFSSLAVLICLTCKVLEGLSYLGSFYMLTKIADLFSGMLWYLSLREESIEPKEKPHKKEIKVEDSIFRLRKRPENITEEEVSISKEKKICLVCKGKVVGHTFICRECEAFYCEKCYSALTNLENACWACDNALDESKPMRLPEKDVEQVVVEGEIYKKIKKK
jgi:hypothetical protein